MTARRQCTSLRRIRIRDSVFCYCIYPPFISFDCSWLTQCGNNTQSKFCNTHEVIKTNAENSNSNSNVRGINGTNTTNLSTEHVTTRKKETRKQLSLLTCFDLFIHWTTFDQSKAPKSSSNKPQPLLSHTIVIRSRGIRGDQQQIHKILNTIIVSISDTLLRILKWIFLISDDIQGELSPGFVWGRSFGRYVFRTCNCNRHEQERKVPRR